MTPIWKVLLLCRLPIHYLLHYLTMSVSLQKQVNEYTVWDSEHNNDAVQLTDVDENFTVQQIVRSHINH